MTHATSFSHGSQMQQLRARNAELKSRLAELIEARSLENENHRLEQQIDRYHSIHFPHFRAGLQPYHGQGGIG